MARLEPSLTLTYELTREQAVDGIVVISLRLHEGVRRRQAGLFVGAGLVMLLVLGSLGASDVGAFVLATFVALGALQYAAAVAGRERVDPCPLETTVGATYVRVKDHFRAEPQ